MITPSPARQSRQRCGRRRRRRWPRRTRQSRQGQAAASRARSDRSAPVRGGRAAGLLLGGKSCKDGWRRGRLWRRCGCRRARLSRLPGLAAGQTPPGVGDAGRHRCCANRRNPLPAANAGDAGRTLLRAVDGARDDRRGKADGHIDADEQRKIFDQVERFDLDAASKALVFDALAKRSTSPTWPRGAKRPSSAPSSTSPAHGLIDPDEAGRAVLSGGARLPPRGCRGTGRHLDSRSRPCCRPRERCLITRPSRRGGGRADRPGPGHRTPRRRRHCAGVRSVYWCRARSAPRGGGAGPQRPDGARRTRGRADQGISFLRLPRSWWCRSPAATRPISTGSPRRRRRRSRRG